MIGKIYAVFEILSIFQLDGFIPPNYRTIGLYNAPSDYPVIPKLAVNLENVGQPVVIFDDYNQLTYQGHFDALFISGYNATGVVSVKNHITRSTRIVFLK